MIVRTHEKLLTVTCVFCLPRNMTGVLGSALWYAEGTLVTWCLRQKLVESPNI